MVNTFEHLLNIECIVDTNRRPANNWTFHDGGSLPALGRRYTHKLHIVIVFHPEFAKVGRKIEKVRSGSTIGFVRKGLLLLRSGYVRELAAASYPHIQWGGDDFPLIAGSGCGGWRLA